ncbi:HSPG2 [Branchiostoma lanceolatum]|uniref:HSPG2 protein n=1 Tax=Branchiostoma lanceolatum TaxID=7740 RepID=A0A8J9YPU0_BRALA|nr:HSPG2 [Branchiostoma lanceolatum]
MMASCLAVVGPCRAALILLLITPILAQENNFLLTEVERRGDGKQGEEIPTDEVESPTDSRFNETERVTLRIKEVDIEDPTVRDLLDQLDLVGSTDLPQKETTDGDHEILEAPSVEKELYSSTVDSDGEEFPTKPLESPTDGKELPTDFKNTELEGKEEFPTVVHTFARAEVATEERDFTEKHMDIPVIVSEDEAATEGLEVPTDEIESPTDEFLELPTVDHRVFHPEMATEFRLYPTEGEHSEIPTEAKEMPTDEELLRVTPNRFERPTEEDLDLTTEEEEGQLETPTEEDDKFLIVVTPEKPTEQEPTTKQDTTTKRETELPTSALETVTPDKVDEVEKQLNQTEIDLTGIPDISDEEFLEVPDTETNEIDEIDISQPSNNRVPSSLDSMEFSDEPDLSESPTIHLTPVRDAPDSSDDEDYFNEEESGSGEIPPWEIPEVPSGPYPISPTYRPEPPQGLQYYRVKINFTTSIQYSEALESYRNPEHQQLSAAIQYAIDRLYFGIPGEQEATVVQYRLFGESVFVTLDLATLGNDNEVQLFNIINNAVNSGYLDFYAVDSEGFEFYPVKAGPGGGTQAPPPACEDNDFRCDTGECIPRGLVCDAIAHCRDESDESRCGEMTKCQMLLETTDVVPGAYIPQCEEDGSFKTTQCHGSTGYCYCAHPTDGTLYEETGKRPWEEGEEHDCDTYWQTAGREKVNCQTLVEIRDVAPGAYIPQCEEDGSYKTTQCYGSTGYCYCAHPIDGILYLETGIRLVEGRSIPHNCDTYWQTAGQEKTKCQTLVETTQPLDGAYIPQCEEDGSFKTTQCHGSTGYCYCAHPTDGTLYDETAKRPWEEGEEHDCDTYWQTAGEEKTKCQTLVETTEPLRGAYIPQCEEDGSFKTTQCHGSTGYCYCAHPTDGTLFRETGRRSWEGGMEHDCNTYWQTVGQEKTKCQTLVETTDVVPGAYIPQCEEDGSFKTTQCRGSTGYCYCTHPTDGTLYDETGKAQWEGGMEHDCNTYWQTVGQEKTKCQTLVETTDVVPGAYIPQCEEDGSFKTTQCHGSTGYCYCAHPTDGTLYDETGKAQWEGGMEHDCNTYWQTVGQEKTKCQTLVETTEPIPGAYIPQCEEDGSFKTTQCHGSSGYCYCAHPTDGTLYEETGMAPWEGGMQHDCNTYWQTVGQEKTKCQTLVETTEPIPGAYIPQCEEDGSFKTTQCHGSTGYCYCAHPTDGTLFRETGRRSWEGGMEHDCNTYWQRTVVPLTPPPPIPPPTPPPMIPVVPGARPDSGIGCRDDQFRCRESGQCIDVIYVCDGDPDCRDYSDEAECEDSIMPRCEPNEFECANGKCAQKIWTCDGDNDCGDNSDESNCPTAPPGSQCRGDEFTCLSGDQCIPQSYQCDEEIDCRDRSDEIGCSAPSVQTPPADLVQVEEGSTVTLTCEAVGNPTPIISWRLNWGHVGQPPRVTQEYAGGRGTLTIRDVRKSDQGAYTCEAINNKGSIFAVPDAVLAIREPEGACSSPGTFNAAAVTTSECLQCFCFGVSQNCRSSDYYRFQLTVPENSGLTMVTSDRSQSVDRSYIRAVPARNQFLVEDMSSVPSGEYYWSLPTNFLGNIIASYGGKLRYTVYYSVGTGDFARFIDAEDIILIGGGAILTYRHYNEPVNEREETIEVELRESLWTSSALSASLSREDFMMILQSVEAILIKASYNSFMVTTSIQGIGMDTAVEENTGQSRAVMVEQCSCPAGYTGLSCERCETGYIRQNGGRFLGSCVPVGGSGACNCNGHSTDCDQLTGECRNCQHNTDGPNCEQCKAGYYGDPLSGFPDACQACPCPLSTPSNQFSPTCFLDSDGQPTCDACPPGYTGRRCERCSPGYVGNPTIPGDYCKRDNVVGPITPVVDRCDARGSMRPDPSDGRCHCRENVQGPECDVCKPNTFHLSDTNSGGCIRCFCMGVGQQCTSTSWGRFQVRAKFETASTQDFQLMNKDQTRIVDQGLTVNPVTRSLVYRQFQQLPQDVYYWLLPESFLGNKLTSYGGVLRYTLSYQPAPGAAPVVDFDAQLSGNSILLTFRHEQQAVANIPRPFIITFQEQYWRRPDGEPATREHMLMALANVDALMIRATYATAMMESSISDVSLDIAEDRATGQGPALHVEQCVCPPGYAGLSCEECAPGYGRNGEGLYLGMCVPGGDAGTGGTGETGGTGPGQDCSCNNHAYGCDASGVCQNCQHNTEGPNCDRCRPGFYGDPTRGNADDCLECPCPLSIPSNQFSPTCFLDIDRQPTCDACPPGYTGRRCERCDSGYTGNPSIPGDSCRPVQENNCQCNDAGSFSADCDANGQCNCKDGMTGLRCDQCAQGYFFLNPRNPDGCMECFCMGVTDQCNSSPYYRDQVEATFLQQGNFQNFALVNMAMTQRITTGFRVNPSSRDLQYQGFSQLGSDPYFWQLPAAFRGNKVTAYGGRLVYSVSHVPTPTGRPLVGLVDVELIGNEIMLMYRHNQQLTPRESRTFEVIFREEYWQRADGVPATREQILMALADVENILIRASYNSEMQQSSIRDVSMDIAVPQNTGQLLAVEVEECRCPPGYTGLSCQDCAPGFTRNGEGLYLGMCAPCDCNGHASICDPETGACQGCRDNTIGEYCDQCAPGFFGDPSSGRPDACRPCPCPLPSVNNQFSPTCFLDTDSRPTCDACPPGYSGRDCGECSPGYNGNPRVPGGRCTQVGVGPGPGPIGPGPGPGPVAPQQPSIQIYPQQATETAGRSAQFRCDVSGAPPFQISWGRSDGRPLPQRYRLSNENSVLTISNLESGDSGYFICRGSNLYGTAQSQAQLTVTAPTVPIRVIVDEPKTLQATQGQTVQFKCIAFSQVTYTLVWTKNDGSGLPAEATDFMGILTIPNVQQQHTGVYTCTGSNMYSIAQDSAQLYVQALSQSDVNPPEVKIEPRFQTVNIGDPVQFRCISSGFPPPQVEWTGGHRGVLNPASSFVDGVFSIPAAIRQDEAEYFCKARNSAGETSVRTVLYVRLQGAPEVTVRPEVMEVPEGERVVLECSARGNPAPTLSWNKYNDPLPVGVVESNGVLTIPQARLSDSGHYVCTGSNSVGTEQKRVELRISRLLQRPPTAAIETVGPGGQVSQPNLLTATLGQTVQLRCVVSGEPVPTITWGKHGGALAQNHQVLNDVLRIVRVSSADRGMYVCTVDNMAGVSSASIMLEVESRDLPAVQIFPTANMDLQIGQSTQLQCQATSGRPAPTIVWSRAGNEEFTDRIDVRDGILTIRDVTPAEQGAYVCTANNDIGSIQATANIRVQGYPRVTISPAGPVSVGLGDRLYLECVATGDPAPVVRWTRSGQPTTRARVEGGDTQNSAVLEIDRVSVEDSGVYTCESNNNIGISESSVQVIVSEARVGPDEVPVVTITPPFSTVVEGDPAEFKCTATGSPPPRLRWQKIRGAQPPRYQVQQGTLTIPSVRREDEGEYSCTAVNYAGEASLAARLVVQVIPMVSIDQETMTVSPGEEVRLRCEAEGTEPIMYEWTRVDGDMSTRATTSGGLLIIQQVTTEDMGQYRCLITNPAGIAEGFTNIIVTAEPTIKTISPKESMREAGSTAEFGCAAAGFPVPSIQWFKEGGTLPEQHVIFGNILRIPNLKPEDAGTYICAASNNLGSTEEKATLRVTGGVTVEPPAVEINLKTAVQMVRIGERVEFDCSASGQPRPLIEWTKIDGRLPDNAEVRDGVLTIPAVRPGDEGRYQCQATNQFGSENQEVTLSLEAAPTMTVKPEVRNVMLGSTAVFTCLASGSPPPEITWRKENGDLPDDHMIDNGVLTIPSITKEDAGAYICSARNDEGAAEFRAILNVGELIPYFTQTPLSYMTFPTLREAYLQFDIEVSFKPESTEGLILYNGQKNGGAGDFMSLGLSEGYVEFRFDVGSGAAVIRSKNALELGRFHTVVLKRNSRFGSLSVDGLPAVNGTSQGNFRGLDLIEPLHVGGVPDYAAISTASGLKSGFIGCLSRLEISAASVNLASDAINIVGVSDCPTCADKPCKNGGTCVEATTEYGFRCECPEGYSGRTCEGVGERCYPGACGPGGKCNNDPGPTGFTCSCPIGRTGVRCGTGIVIVEPAFSGNSFIAYQTMQNVQRQTRITMEFKLDSLTDGLLLFNGQRLSGSGDFISLAVKDGAVEFRFDSGSGPAIIRSSKNVSMDTWHTIKAERDLKDGSLSLDGLEATKGQSPGNTQGVNLRMPLHLGGMESFDDLPDRVGVSKGLFGCIASVQVNSISLDLVNAVLDSANIQDCGERTCDRAPCQNGATCIQMGDNYVCRCSPQFEGRHCETALNPCQVLTPCLNGGKCEQQGSDYRCMCPLGYKGKDCEEKVELADFTAAFDRDGYIEMPNKIMGRGFWSEPEYIEFHFRTTMGNGVIFWQGVEEGSTGRNMDFISIAVSDGYLVFSYELGSGEANIQSEERINDGEWHHVKTVRTGQNGELTIDEGRPIPGKSGGSLQSVNAKGSVYIGGMPDITKHTGDKYRTGMVGCVYNLRLQNRPPINLLLDNIGGSNVLPCPTQPPPLQELP